MSAFFSHRALHEQNREQEHERQHGENPKAVEVGKRRCSLLTQIFEPPQSQQLRRGRIAVLLDEARLSLIDEGGRGRVERIEMLAEA